MAASISISLAAHSYLSGSHTRASRLASPCPPPSSTFSARRPSGAPLCAAARHQQWPPPKKRSSAQRPPRPPPRRRAPERDFRGSGRGRGRVAEMVRAPVVVEEEEQQYEEFEEYEEEVVAGRSRSPAALPKPPAGFVLDAQGRCIAAGSKRTITIVDETNDRPLECLIRRVFRSSREHECMLLCPVDAPVQVLKSTNFAGWTAVDGDDLKEIVPAVAYALAKVYMHFVESGFCYTARGGFCFPEDAIQEFHDSGDDTDGAPFEAVEITCFNLDGAHYMIYTPVDPLLFVAVKDENGVFRIAEDDLLDDPGVLGAIDEETEFTALVEEEEALLESVLGESR